MVEVHVPVGSVPTIRGDRDPIEVHMVRVDGSPFPQVQLVYDDPMPGFTPQRARQLAVLLCQAADRADGHPTTVRDVPRAQIDRQAEPLGPQPARPDHIEAAERGLL